MDKANGKGRMIHANGDVYLGDYVSDKPEGQGTYTTGDGAQNSGLWKDG